MKYIIIIKKIQDTFKYILGIFIHFIFGLFVFHYTVRYEL